MQHRSDAGVDSFAVIDSNCKAGSTPRALELLRQLGADRLSFVAITHPHADHYMGMRAILEAYSGKVDLLFTFPIRRERGDIQRIVEAYKKHATSTDDAAQQRQSLELAHIFLLAQTAVGEWEDPSGTRTVLAVPGFEGVRLWTLLPPSRVKGNFFQQILSGSLEPENVHLNDLSMAFLLEYDGHQIVLGGDGTEAQWLFQEKRWKNDNWTITSSAVKVPHHGSKQDCSSKVMDVIFGREVPQPNSAIACVSANGKTHPSPDVLDEFVRRGIRPYCTNLARRCGANLRALATDPNVDPALLRLINSAAVDDGATQPCQGDITIEFAPGQAMSVGTQHKNLCPLRGDLGFLSNGEIR